MHSPTHNAQFKIRGKKTYRLLCGCCVMLNVKDKLRWKEAAKEIKQL